MTYCGLFGPSPSRKSKFLHPAWQARVGDATFKVWHTALPSPPYRYGGFYAPSPPLAPRINRGGFDWITWEDSAFLRAWNSPASCDPDMGFRIACLP